MANNDRRKQHDYETWLRTHGRILTIEEQNWLNLRNYERGFDVDTCKYQHRHICIPGCGNTDIKPHPICGSEFLWFVGGEWGTPRGDKETYVEEDNRITCQECLDELARLMAFDRKFK